MKEGIRKRINELSHLAKIVRPFGDYIILAQSESDFISKRNKIIKGDRLGFYRLK